MPWGGMGQNIQVVQMCYLEGLEVRVSKPFIGIGRHTGLIFDWTDGFSRYPQEHKPLSLIALKSGQFCLMPNNYILFEDRHFVNEKSKENLQFYKRGESVYWE